MILGHSWNEIYPVTPSEMSKIIIVSFYTEHCINSILDIL